MAGFLGATADLARPPYPSIYPSFAGVSETCKRKRDEDDTGLLLNSDTESQLTKRQKSVIYCNKSNAGGSREYFPQDESINGESNEEESRGSQWIDSLVRQTIYANDKKTDQLPFQGHQSAIYTNNITQASKLGASPTWNEPPTWCSSLSADVFVPLHTTKESKVAQKDTVNVSDRKRHFMYTPDDALKEKMKKYVHDVYKLFGAIRKRDNCRLHRSPPPARSNGRPMGTIKCGFAWKDSSGKQQLNVNFGIVALIVKGQITKDQMEGYVNKSWHLSHLCGNWTCCNWRHMTVECGRTNVSRNQCFRSAGGCSHEPPCMKDRKRRFPVTVNISNYIRGAIKFISSNVTPTAGFRSSDFTAVGWKCEICGEDALCFGSRRICHSLTSSTKSKETLAKLESCTQPNHEVWLAITYLRNIIADLSREKRARHNGLGKGVAQHGVNQSACLSQKSSLFYG